jgi:hypothetical protein
VVVKDFFAAYLAIVLVQGAWGAGVTLKQIAAVEGDVEVLEAKLRKGVIGLRGQWRFT